MGGNVNSSIRGVSQGLIDVCAGEKSTIAKNEEGSVGVRVVGEIEAQCVNGAQSGVVCLDAYCDTVSERVSLRCF